MRNAKRPFEAPLPEPLAYFLTWHTYGTWLPGDDRGWVKRHRGHQNPDAGIRAESARRMADDPCLLDREQRALVEMTIREHCAIRGWTLHAVNCRSNHVHAVVAANAHPERVRDQFKSYCTKELGAMERKRAGAPSSLRKRWWAERGSRRYLNDEDSLEAAIRYVRDAQDIPH